MIKVQAKTSLELAKASYHLGNRHVDLELREKNLFLLKDCVIERMLLKRGLEVTLIRRPFYPELGAYADAHAHHLH